MFLKELHLYNFKNINSASLNFDSSLVFFCGQNGVGKTTVLDAIHYLALTKSFIHFTDTENITFGKEYFQINAKFIQNLNTEEYTCTVHKDGGKRFRYFQKEYQRLYDHIGKIPIIVISPSDQLYIIEGSEVRRKLIDSMISQINKEYLVALMEYNRILKQRNSLLKSEQSQKVKNELLEIFNEQLLMPGNYIHETRKSFVKKLEIYLKENYGLLSLQTNEKANIIYKSQLHDNDFKTLLSHNIEKDLSTSSSNVGIHKDDYLFLLNDKTIRYFASQGQQKTYITALKLSFIPIIKEDKQSPIILLDDIFDKLDDNRVQNMVNLVKSSQCQSFLTHTDIQKIQSFFPVNLFNLCIFQISKEGEFSKINH